MAKHAPLPPTPQSYPHSTQDALTKMQCTVQAALWCGQRQPGLQCFDYLYRNISMFFTSIIYMYKCICIYNTYINMFGNYRFSAVVQTDRSKAYASR